MLMLVNCSDDAARKAGLNPQGNEGMTRLSMLQKGVATLELNDVPSGNAMTWTLAQKMSKVFFKNSQH